MKTICNNCGEQSEIMAPGNGCHTCNNGIMCQATAEGSINPVDAMLAFDAALEEYKKSGFVEEVDGGEAIKLTHKGRAFIDVLKTEKPTTQAEFERLEDEFMAKWANTCSIQ